MAHSTEARPASGSGAALLGLRVASGATLLLLLWQFVSAGNYSGEGDPTWLWLHSVGAIVTHVVAGLAVVAAALLWRAGAPAWPTVLALVVLALTFVQALVSLEMSLHIPGAMVLVVGSAVLTAWSVRPDAALSSRRAAS